MLINNYYNYQWKWLVEVNLNLIGFLSKLDVVNLNSNRITFNLNYNRIP
jgi:hypothetical protein